MIHTEREAFKHLLQYSYRKWHYENNHSRFGGGLYIGSSNSYIYKTIISNNLSDSHGGGVWVGGGSESVCRNINFRECRWFGGGVLIMMQI